MLGLDNTCKLIAATWTEIQSYCENGFEEGLFIVKQVAEKMSVPVELTET